MNTLLPEEIGIGGLTKDLKLQDILELRFISKDTNKAISKEFGHYYAMLPEYMKKGKEFKKIEKHNILIFSTLQNLFPNSSLYDIMVYLQSKKFKNLKQKTDRYISQNGLRRAIEDYVKENLLHISLFDVSNIKDMERVFSRSKFNESLSLWDTSSVENMKEMFMSSKFNHKSINNWDTSSVTNMEGMFNSSKFNKPINSWDTSKVTNMREMFADSEFSQDLNDWNTSSVEDMEDMFIRSEFNGSVGRWDTSSVESMSGMFAMSVFEGDVGSWDTSNVTDMNSMFMQCPFDGYLDNWDVSNVEDMNSMFMDSPFDGHGISKWDVSNVKDMRQMFYNTLDSYEPNLKEDLNNWKVNENTNVYNMFKGQEIERPEWYKKMTSEDDKDN
tara:strand:- start:114 stop:1271 length:1158 start_codon:yes stop_codon:yes gene_type:complete